MKLIAPRTTSDRVAGPALILLALIALVTLPLWIIPAVVWLIATGRNPASCNREANQMSTPAP